MPLIVRCPNAACGQPSSVAEHQAGQAVRCPHCQTEFTVSYPGSALRTAVTAETVPGRPPSPPAEIPQQIGRFLIRARLGAGTFGAVYRAFDTQMHREVALKVPHTGMPQSPEDSQRYLREVTSTARLHHPHIVPLYEAGNDGKNSYIASAFIEGKTLAQSMKESRFSFRRSAQLIHD